MLKTKMLFAFVTLTMLGCASDRRFDAIQPETAVVAVEGTLGRVGRGFFVSPDGTIVTSSRVVGDARKLKVTTSNGRVLESTVQSSDPEAEVAVLKVTTPAKGREFRILHLDDADAVPGMHVRAVGGAGITQGVFDHWEDFGRSIDFTAKVGPDDAGAPLLADDGRVIGIVAGPFENHYKATPAWRASRLLPAKPRGQSGD